MIAGAARTVARASAVLEQMGIKCGSGLARDGAITFNIDGD
jgi:hypothetical protein